MSIDIDSIRSSFEVAKPIASEVVTKFYDFLLTDYPELQPLFRNVDMEKQKLALIGSLVFIVDNLENGDKLTDYLHEMGARHLDYDVEENQYEKVGSTLLKTLAHFFGENWTSELAMNWEKAVEFIAQTMIDGARKIQMQKNGPNSASMNPNSSSMKLDESLLAMESIRKRVQEIVHDIVHEEINAALSSEKRSDIRRQVKSQIDEIVADEFTKMLELLEQKAA